MKTIETKGGMIFEIWESRKEVLRDLDMFDFDPEFWEDSLYIEYKNGTYFYVGSDGEIEGKLKRNNIKTVIYSNACTCVIYGEYKIYNIDDIEEEYSEETDSEEKFWNVDVA